MRRSFGGNHNGGNGSNGNMLRTLARTVTRSNTTIQDSFSSSVSKSIKTPTSPTSSVGKSRNTNCGSVLSLTTSPTAAGNSSSNSPFVTSPTGRQNGSSWRSRSSSSLCDEFEWVCVDGGGGGFNEFDDHFVLGPAPSRHEAQSAVSALQQVIETASFSQFVRDKYGTTADTDMIGRPVSPTRFNQKPASSILESDWLEPSLQLCGTRALQSYESGTVYDAFHLLQTEPSVQRMVISLSSDPAVWNAVLNNEVVQELRQSISSDKDSTASLKEESDDSEVAASILKWLLHSTKEKITEIIGMINKLVSDLFKPFEGDHGKPSSTTSTDSFEEKLRYSLMLTVVVLLIITVARAKRA